MAGNFEEIRENTNPNLHPGDISLKLEIPNSTCSISTPSDLSEPPDIKNWFSCYVYESPVLDTEVAFKGFGSGKSEIDKVGVDSEEQNHLGTKIPNSSSLISKPSDLSEPPDLRNWFSSYVYESPVLDAEDELKYFISGKSEIEKVGLDCEMQNQLGTEDNCLAQRQSAANICDDESFGGKQKETNDYASDGDTKLSCMNDGDRLQLGDEQKETNDHASLGNTRSSCMNDGNYEQKLECSLSFAEGLVGSKDNKEATKGKSCTKEADFDADTGKNNKTSAKTTLSCSNGDGSKEKESVANGFICTKKNKYTNENDRNHLKQSHENYTEYRKETQLKLPLSETHLGVRRPLYETTNLRHEVAIPETTGKWRCPQRSKPDLGPPLKQLRLERWVRRVQ